MKKFISDIIIKPLMTEKTASLGESQCYVFEVSPTATKNEIRDSIQKFFELKLVYKLQPLLFFFGIFLKIY